MRKMTADEEAAELAWLAAGMWARGTGRTYEDAKLGARLVLKLAPLHVPAPKRKRGKR